MEKTIKNDNYCQRETYVRPEILAVHLNLEQGIAAGSVQTGLQQEHNEENQSFDIEW